MELVDLYLRRADEARRLAEQATTTDERDTRLKQATHWGTLASAREAYRQRESSAPTELSE